MTMDAEFILETHVMRVEPKCEPQDSKYIYQ